MSVAIIIAVISLALAISALHVWAFCRMPSPRRGPYLTVLIILIVGTLFIPIYGGDDHLAPIRLCNPYQVLAIPIFYSASNRDSTIDSAMIAAPLIQHVTCVLLASLTVRRRSRTEQASASDADKPPC